MKALFSALLGIAIFFQATAIAQTSDACSSEREQGGLALQVCLRKEDRAARQRNIQALNDELNRQIDIIEEEFDRQEDVLELAKDEKDLSYKFGIEDVKRQIDRLRRFNGTDEQIELLRLYQQDLETERSIFRSFYDAQIDVLDAERELQIARLEFQMVKNAATIHGTGRIRGGSYGSVH